MNFRAIETTKRYILFNDEAPTYDFRRLLDQIDVDFILRIYFFSTLCNFAKISINRASMYSIFVFVFVFVDWPSTKKLLFTKRNGFE